MQYAVRSVVTRGPDVADLDFERPPFLDAGRMDRADYIHPSATFGGISAGLYQNASRSLGVSDVLPVTPVFQIPVMFSAVPAINAWRDGRRLSLPGQPTGSISSFDMRQQWQVELGYPFNSLHFYIPQTAFDDLSREIGQPQIRELKLSPGQPSIDPLVYHLAQALAFLMDAPWGAPRLLTDQIFCALRTHIATRYGGVLLPSRRPAGLSVAQVRRVKSLMLDDLEHDVRLDELATACGLTADGFRRGFKAAFGRAPHQWRLTQKVERARSLIEYSDTPLVEISARCGFADQSHLTRVFSRSIGVSPAAYRRMRRRERAGGS
jgi:AraC family transcriptional regulator